MKKSRNRRKRILLRLQHILTGAAVVCVAVIALLLVNALRGNEISGPGRTAGSALFASGGERFVEAGEEARIMAEQQGEKAENVGTESADSEQEKTDTENTTETGLSPEKLAVEEGVPRIRIVLDPGHGGPGTTDEQELGAIYRDTYEKYLTLKIAKAAGAELSNYGNVEILYTRESDKALTLKERAAYARSVGADYLISLHLNASAEHNFFGSEVFTSAFGSYYARGKGIGDQVLAQLTGVGFVSKGVKTRLGSKGADYYGIIRESRALGIPAIIIEHGYMDQDEDWARMDTDEKLAALGRCDAAGIAAYFGLKKGENQAELPEIDRKEPASSPVRPDTTEPVNVYYTLTRRDAENVRITLHAEEPESRVMYYDYSTDGGTTYSRLFLWPEGSGNDITFTLPATASQEETLVIRAYNNYELRTEAERQ